MSLDLFSFPASYYPQFIIAAMLIISVIVAVFVWIRWSGSRSSAPPRNSLDLSKELVGSVGDALSETRDGYWLVDDMGLIQSTNQAVAAILDQSGRQFIDCDFRSILSDIGVDDGCLKEVGRAFDLALRGQSSSMELKPCIQAPHFAKGLKISLTPLTLGHLDKGPTGVVIVGLHEKHSSRRSEVAGDSLALCLDAVDLPVMIINCTQSCPQLHFANDAFIQLSGSSADNLFVRDPLVILEPLMDGADLAMLRSAIHKNSQLSMVTKKSDVSEGKHRYFQVYLSQVHDGTGQVIYQTLTFKDVTEAHWQSNQLTFRNTRDPLTGLPNRVEFQGYLRNSFYQETADNKAPALLYIDLDEFSVVNNILSYSVGDKLLANVADRIQQVIGRGDMLARMCADEFVIFVTEENEGNDTRCLAKVILEELARPYQVLGREIRLTASIGIAVRESNDMAPEGLLQKAHMAMLRAKRVGRNTYGVYENGIATTLERRAQMRSELQEAIDSKDIKLQYQSIVNASGTLTGFEALIRWQHKQHGSVSPSKFITLAEETGQIDQLSRWCLERACKDAKLLVDSGILTGRMSVNVSSKLIHRFNFVDFLHDILQETGLSPEFLELELSQAALMQDIAAAQKVIEELLEMGVTTSVDKFGAIFSGPTCLSSLSVRKIKIDQSLVKYMESGFIEASVCKGIISLAHNMKMEVVAEGVESERQYSHLRQMGCDYFQGFLFSNPEPFEVLVKDYQMCGIVTPDLTSNVFLT